MFHISQFLLFQFDKQVFLLFCSSISLFFAKEAPLEGKTGMVIANEQKSGVIELLKSLRHLPPGMRPVLIVSFLSWVLFVRHKTKTHVLVRLLIEHFHLNISLFA